MSIVSEAMLRAAYEKLEREGQTPRSGALHPLVYRAAQERGWIMEDGLILWSNIWADWFEAEGAGA